MNLHTASQLRPSPAIENRRLPAVGILHGVYDPILSPVTIVRHVKTIGLQEVYYGLNDKHVMQPHISEKAIQWFVKNKSKQHPALPYFTTLS